MRSSAVLLALVALAVAAPSPRLPFVVNTAQDGFAIPATAQFEAAGIDIDLNSLRLIQFEDWEPVWMTELEKVFTPLGFQCLTRRVKADVSRFKPSSRGLSSSTCTSKPLTLFSSLAHALCLRTDTQDLGSSVPHRGLMKRPYCYQNMPIVVC
jgi:hypothetical protein